MPAGADPHEFEPSAAEVAIQSEADLVVANGLGFEAASTDALEAAADDGVDVLDLGEQLDPLPSPTGTARTRTGSPTLDARWRAVGLIADGGGRGRRDRRRGDRRTGEATPTRARRRTPRWATTSLAVPAADRRLVTNHEVFGYFADRYGFEVIGTIIPSGTTLAEPSSADLSALVDIIDETGVPAIFADTSRPASWPTCWRTRPGRTSRSSSSSPSRWASPAPGARPTSQLIRTNADRIVGALA